MIIERKKVVSPMAYQKKKSPTKKGKKSLMGYFCYCYLTDNREGNCATKKPYMLVSGME